MYDPNEGRVIGEQGFVTTRIPGGDAPGEVQIPLRGGSESFIAYATEHIGQGQRVLVIGRRPGRAVDVTVFSV
jgi:hypothetical protein